jgi:hypothetical protein
VYSVVWRGAAKYRWFDIAELLAGAAAARSDSHPSTRRLHAQMLLERGFTEEALVRLQAILALPDLPEFDRGQAYGHVGRIHKDRFVAAAGRGDDAAARAALALALDAYQTGVREIPAELAWLGVNAAALLSRPEAAALDPQAREKARAIARDIQAEVARQQAAAQKKDLYADATVAEAWLALDDPGRALPLVARYVFDPDVNVFALNNFHRQLREVWRIDRGPSPGPEILALVGAALLEKPDGTLQISGSELQRAKDVRFEAVFGADRFDSLENYRRGLERCSCVVRIGRSAETGVGTGFLLPGQLLSEKLAGRFVLVTNAHVISEADAEREKGALHPAEAVVTFAAFTGVDPDRQFGVSRIIFSSPREELDAVVAELSEPLAPDTPYPMANVLPVATSQAPVRMIGHPSGRGLSLSVNQLLDHDSLKLHYRTASEGGSSGSPVFNQEWHLIGLHHAGGDAVPRLRGQAGTYQANEGISIKSIAEAVRRFLS